VKPSKFLTHAAELKENRKRSPFLAYGIIFAVQHPKQVA
jgi:hypothetical protein